MNQSFVWLLAGTIGCAVVDAEALGAPAEEECCAVLELRQYRTKPGRRDDLIALVDRHLLEGQEAYPMRIVGQFRNPQSHDHWVWIRGFADMQSRHRALTGFYEGPLWKEHRGAANDTMEDVSNVLLLKPASATGQLRVGARPLLDGPAADGGLVVVTIHYLGAPADEGFLSAFSREAEPLLREAGATMRGQFVTEPSRNTFTALPVREGEHVFVWIASFADRHAYDAYAESLAADGRWKARVEPVLAATATRLPETLVLVPTQRSKLRHPPP